MRADGGIRWRALLGSEYVRPAWHWKPCSGADTPCNRPGELGVVCVELVTQAPSPPTTNCITGVSLANPGTLAAGNATTCVVLNTTGVVCWGSNFYGTLGNGFANVTVVSTPPVSSPVLFGAVAVTVGSAHVCALMNTTGFR